MWKSCKTSQISIEKITHSIFKKYVSRQYLVDNSGPTCPSSFTIMLLLCLSPMPRMKVATQYPAQDRVNKSTARSYLQTELCQIWAVKHYDLQFSNQRNRGGKCPHNIYSLLTSLPCSCLWATGVVLSCWTVAPPSGHLYTGSAWRESSAPHGHLETCSSTATSSGLEPGSVKCSPWFWWSEVLACSVAGLKQTKSYSVCHGRI